MAVLALVVLPAVAFAQGTSPDAVPSPDGQSDQEHPRIFGIIPNYRTSPTLQDYHPLTVKQKYRVAADDALDRGTFLLAANIAASRKVPRSSASSAATLYFCFTVSGW